MIETSLGTVGFPRPQPITPDTSVSVAAHHLRRPEVPALVVREEDAIVGIVTDSDIVAMVAETDERQTIRTIMSTPVVTVSPSETVHDAAETMRSTGVKHLPVVSDGTYDGLLSIETLAPYLPRHKLETEWQGKPLRVESVDSATPTASD